MAAEAANKNTQAITLEFIDTIEKSFYRSGKTSLTVLDYNVGTQFITFPLSPFSPFYEDFHETILRLIEAGICPDRMNGKMKKVVFQSKRRNEDVPPLVLTLDDLGIGFIVCSVPLCFSALVFLLEVLIPKIFTLSCEMRDCSVAYFVIRAVNLPHF